MIEVVDQANAQHHQQGRQSHGDDFKNNAVREVFECKDISELTYLMGL